jgi:hypothetical protein
VGAQLGARLIVEAMVRALPAASCTFWQRVHTAVLQRLRDLAEHLGGPLARTVQDYFLFTIVGALVTPLRTWVFALGDGVIAVNGDVLSLGPFAHNAPPYLAYALLDAPMPGATSWQCQRTMPTPAVQSIVLGTDGLEAWLRAEAQPLPGQRGTVGALQRFWQDEHYFRNPDAVRRTLAMANREVLQPDWEAQRLHRHTGLLPDDTTLVVIRRRPVSCEEGYDGRVS